jgi:hypothetical protein
MSISEALLDSIAYPEHGMLIRQDLTKIDRKIYK